MTTEHNALEAAPTPQASVPTKSAMVIKLLSRGRGATVPELGSATNWQPHSVRAFLSGLRKKGTTLTKEERKDGERAYRIVKSGPASEKVDA